MKSVLLASLGALTLAATLAASAGSAAAADLLFIGSMES